MATTAQRRRALQAADQLLTELAVDQESPVDVFGMISQLGLWLVFNPLGTLLGAVLPKGNGGIMLTTQRRPAIQRYTAAHEIGHWILDIHEVAFDTEDHIFRPSVDRERLAQLFAGQLLMPPPLVFASCARYDISDGRHATGAAVYLVARDMGASYEAAVRQMSNLGIINRTRLQYLLSLSPADIKAELCRGHRPADAVDVWPLDNSFDGHQVNVTEGDELFVALPENRTTGYRWLTDDQIRVRGEREIAPAPEPFPEGRETQKPTRNMLPRLLGDSPDAQRDRSIASVKRSLAQVPGNNDSRRILPRARGSGASATSRLIDSAEQASRWETSATAVPPAELLLVDDRYESGWAAVPASDVRNVRRAIAGRRDLILPDSVNAYRTQATNPAEPRRTGLRAGAIPVAATGYRLMAVKSSGEGARSFTLSYSSAFDPHAPTVEHYNLDVVVTPTPQVQHRRELLQIDIDDDSRSGDHDDAQ